MSRCFSHLKTELFQNALWGGFSVDAVLKYQNQVYCQVGFHMQGGKYKR